MYFFFLLHYFIFYSFISVANDVFRSGPLCKSPLGERASCNKYFFIIIEQLYKPFFNFQLSENVNELFTHF